MRRSVYVSVHVYLCAGVCGGLGVLIEKLVTTRYNHLYKSSHSHAGLLNWILPRGKPLVCRWANPCILTQGTIIAEFLLAL